MDTRRLATLFAGLTLLAALLSMITGSPGGSGPASPSGPANQEASGALENEEGAPEDWVLSQRAAVSGVPRNAPLAASRQADAVAALTVSRDPGLTRATWA